MRRGRSPHKFKIAATDVENAGQQSDDLNIRFALLGGLRHRDLETSIVQTGDPIPSRPGLSMDREKDA